MKTEKCTFDDMGIDYVVPMVFNDDAEWQKEHQKAGKRYNAFNPFEHVRYRSWGTERLLIQLVKKNMPWLRRIIVLLAQESQKQPWMDEEGVTVVYHRDFIPERHLPTFNSRGMEMFLKDIPGLSDTFIYGNDDMFPIAPLKEEDFFQDGLPCQRYHVNDFPESPSQFHVACLGGLNFVASEFGISYEKKWLKGGHSIAPILKSSCEHLWKRGGAHIENSITPYREACNFNQYIYGWYQHFSGKYVDHVPSRKYVNVKKGVDEVRDTIRDGGYQIVCVNDNEIVWNISEYAEVVREELEKKLNEK